MSLIPNELEKEISDILNFSRKYEFPKISYILHNEIEDILVTRIMHLDITSDYNKDLSDVITVDFVIGRGTYRDKILANRDRLEISITLEYVDEKIINKYRFILLNIDDTAGKSPNNAITSNSMDTTDIINVTGQCVDPVMIGLKQSIVSGIYKDTTVYNMLRAVIAEHLSKVKIGGYTSNVKFNIIKPNNTRVYDHIIIKSNTKLTRLPYMLQHADYGVYNGDINMYLSRAKDKSIIVNIYPLYDYTLYDTSVQNKLLLYSPAISNKGVNESTYFKIKPESLFCKMIAGDIKIINKGDNDKLITGDGLFNVDPNAVINLNNKSFKEDKLGYDTKKLLTKETTVNNTFISNLVNTNLDDNLYKYRSAILKTNSMLVQMTFSKIDTRILYPGMPIQYMYIKDDKVCKQRGVLQNVTTNYNISKKSSITILHMTLERSANE